jgi:hypothetical protein
MAKTRESKETVKNPIVKKGNKIAKREQKKLEKTKKLEALKSFLLSNGKELTPRVSHSER